jgi:hypothetical protein
MERPKLVDRHSLKIFAFHRLSRARASRVCSENKLVKEKGPPRSDL